MTKTYVKRTPEQIIQDLEQRIAHVRERASAREVRTTPTGKALLNAIRALDKAAKVAEEADNREVLAALEAARAPLSTQLVALGVRLPAADGRRGPRRKSEVA